MVFFQYQSLMRSLSISEGRCFSPYTFPGWRGMFLDLSDCHGSLSHSSWSPWLGTICSGLIGTLRTDGSQDRTGEVKLGGSCAAVSCASKDSVVFEVWNQTLADFQGSFPLELLNWGLINEVNCMINAEFPPRWQQTHCKVHGLGLVPNCSDWTFSSTVLLVLMRYHGFNRDPNQF